jgi:hypothetical protein
MENFEQEVVVEKPSHMYRNLFISLAIVVVAVGVFYFILTKSEMPQSQDNVISETSQVANEKSTEMDEIFGKLATSDYKVEIRQNGPCGEGPCDTVEEGVFVVENKQKGFEFNLSKTILKDLVIRPNQPWYQYKGSQPEYDYEVRDVLKVGQDIYFYMSPGHEIYKIDPVKKSTYTVYSKDSFSPDFFTLKNNTIVSGWYKDYFNNLSSAQLDESDLAKGLVVTIDPLATTAKIREYPFTVQVNPNLSLVAPMTSIASPREDDGNTLWVFSQFEPKDVCMKGADCKVIFTIINLKTGEVTHKRASQTTWEDQPVNLNNEDMF